MEVDTEGCFLVILLVWGCYDEVRLAICKIQHLRPQKCVINIVKSSSSSIITDQIMMGQGRVSHGRILDLLSPMGRRADVREGGKRRKKRDASQDNSLYLDCMYCSTSSFT